MFPQLIKLRDELAEAIKRGNDERGAEILRDFKSQNPALWSLAESVFAGTPEQMVEKVSAWLPWVKDFPGSVEFARRLQRRILEEVDKPRGGKAVSEERRLKG